MICICTENIDEFDLKSKFKFIAGSVEKYSILIFFKLTENHDGLATENPSLKVIKNKINLFKIRR